jgi:hypothetical protein
MDIDSTPSVRAVRDWAIPDRLVKSSLDPDGDPDGFATIVTEPVLDIFAPHGHLGAAPL